MKISAAIIALHALCVVVNEATITTYTDADIGKMKSTIETLTGQIMMMQLQDAEKQRSDGDSGIKQVRHGKSGSRPYHAPHFAANSVASMHNHDNNIRTVGMGELTVVLNGYEFRTRHNDFRLYMPNRTSAGLHDVEDIPFPDVPPEVKNKSTVDAQIAEMREWFKAWKNQDYSVRDYRKYFKPVLCYLEGAWTHSDAYIEEPFHSDRHAIDAKTWSDLVSKITFTTATGTKSALENYAFLPTIIVGTTNESEPIVAQWNYRVLCQPLDVDIPLDRFRLVDDLKTRVANRYSSDKLLYSRSARFRLNPFDTDNENKEGFIKYGLIDKLMSKVPGKDNMQANITDDAFDVVAYDMSPDNKGAVLNAGFYHRWASTADKDAMGVDKRKSGFSDDNLFVALTTQEKIVKRTVDSCTGEGEEKVCREWSQRPTYAIPTEVIFLTPLSKWNPYDIVHKGTRKSAEGKTVSADGRNGEKTLDKAYNGTHDKIYYITPDVFFSGEQADSDPADTSKSSLGVLNKNGSLVVVRSSGIRILFPSIEGVGILRQRFPIMPIYSEGSATWKEVDALKDIVLFPRTNGEFLQEDTGGSVASNDTKITHVIELGTSLSSSVTPHTHTVDLTADEVSTIVGYETVTKTTSREIGHSHELVISRAMKSDYYVTRCDGKANCFDYHPREMTLKSQFAS